MSLVWKAKTERSFKEKLAWQEAKLENELQKRSRAEMNRIRSGRKSIKNGGKKTIGKKDEKTIRKRKGRKR